MSRPLGRRMQLFPLDGMVSLTIDFYLLPDHSARPSVSAGYGLHKIREYLHTDTTLPY